jgi:site-specific recombinase XerD
MPKAASPLPQIILQASSSARFAWEEFFDAQLSNQHTRRAYKRAVTQFLLWCEAERLALHSITPGHVGRYVQSLPVEISAKKQALAGIRKFFDLLVVRHAIVLNPALSVRGEKYQLVDGKTPEISKAQVLRQSPSAVAVASARRARLRADAMAEADGAPSLCRAGAEVRTTVVVQLPVTTAIKNP